jgi:DedD protein
VKERLTGAIILVALIVLWVPELLTGPIGSAPRAAAVAPSAEEPPLRSYTINLADDTHSRTAAVMTAAGPNGMSAAQPATESLPPAAASAAPSALAAAPAAPPPLMPAKSVPANARAASAANRGGSWMVQLGSFASRTNAERLARQVKAGGFDVSVSRGSSGRRLFRVRVGPAPDREGAMQLAAKLRAAGHNGSIVPN